MAYARIYVAGRVCEAYPDDRVDGHTGPRSKTSVGLTWDAAIRAAELDIAFLGTRELAVHVHGATILPVSIALNDA